MGPITQRLKSFRPAFPERLYRAVIVCLVASVVVVPGAVWVGLRIPAIPFLNGMAIQGKAGAQSVSDEFPDGMTMRAPVEGTVPLGVRPYPYKGAPGAAEANLVNLLPATMANLKRGEDLFDVYCQPCHGYKGIGDGSATGAGRLPAANSLQAAKLRACKDGRIYHIMTEGQNNMPSYAKQITPIDRWAVVDYVRALQRAMAPGAEDLATTKAKAMQNEK